MQNNRKAFYTIAALFFALFCILGYGISHRIEINRQEEARILKIEYRLDSMQTRIDGLAYQEVKE